MALVDLCLALYILEYLALWVYLCQGKELERLVPWVAPSQDHCQGTLGQLVHLRVLL
jgi:hypothetical protein